MSQFTGLTRVAQLQRWIRAVCNRADVRVEFKDDIPTAYATRSSVVIPRINHAMTVDDEWVLRWQIAHETLGHHNEGPEVFDILEEHKLPTSHPLGAILNIIEDQRIERAVSAAYKGDAAVISNGREVSGRRTLEYINKLTSEMPHDSMEDDTAKMQAVYLTAAISQAEWCPGVALHVRDEVTQINDHFPTVTKHMATLTSNAVVTSINSLDDGYESFDLAKKVYGLLWDKTKDEVKDELEKIKQEAKASGKAGKGEKGDEAGMGDKLGPDGIPLNEVDPRTGKFKLPFEYFVKSNHSTTPEDAIGHGLGLDYTNYTGNDTFQPCPPEQFGVRDYASDPPTRCGTLSAFGGTYNALSATSAFANKMRRYLQVKTAGYYEGGKKKGVLNARSLYKAGLPMVGDGDWNRKVFKQRHVADLLDTSVSLLVDVSASMSGYKVVHATHACMMLNHVISNVLRVNTEIAAFTFDGYPMHYFMKKFGARASDEQVYAAFDDCAHLMLGNGDADSILYAYTRLLEQRTKRKVLIVLSDGSPADGYMDTDPWFALRSVINNITEEKQADVIGIGIRDDSVRHYYPKHVILQQADELEDKLMQIITTQILRG